MITRSTEIFEQRKLIRTNIISLLLENLSLMPKPMHKAAATIIFQSNKSNSDAMLGIGFSVIAW